MGSSETRRFHKVAGILVLGFVVSVPVIAWAAEVGVALTPSHILGLLIISLAPLLCIKSRGLPTLDIASISLLGFAALATLTVCVVLSQPNIVAFGESLHAKAVKQLLGLYFAVALFLSMRYLLEVTGAGLRVLQAYYVTTVVVAILALAQYAAALWDVNSVLANFPVHNSTLGATRSLMTGNTRYGFPRVSLTLVEPSRLSAYLLTGWAMWAYGMTWPDGKSRRPWLTASGLLLGTAVLVTGTRSGYLVFGVLAAGAMLFRPNRIRRTGLIAASAITAALLLGPAHAVKVAGTLLPDTSWSTLEADVSEAEAAASVRDSTPGTIAESDTTVEQWLMSIGTHSDKSVRHRIGSFLVALSVLRDDPWFGEGYGTSQFVMQARYPQEMGPISIGPPMLPTVLSTYGAIIVETGLVGAVLLLGLVGGAFRAVYDLSLRSDGADIAWALAGSLLAYGIAVSGRSIEPYQFLAVWCLLALAVTAPSFMPAEAGSRRAESIRPADPPLLDAATSI